jgi:hypothetical protein
MNPWLVTWEAMGDRLEMTIKNKIAAILPNQTSEKEVEKILYLLDANYSACSRLSDRIYVSEQVRFAKREYPNKALRLSWRLISCGGNPFLLARQVFNLTVSEDEGYQVLGWEETIYPQLAPDQDLVEAQRPFKRKRMMYSTRTNKISALKPAEGS